MAPNDVSSADNAAAFKLPSLVQNCLSLSSSLARHNPFSIGPPAKKNPNLILQPPNYAVFRELHASFASAALDFLGFLRFLASENSPLVEKFLSFSGDFSRHFSQIQCWNARNANSLSNHNFAAVLPGGDSVAGLVVANGILNFLNIYNTLLIVRLVLTWFPNSPPAIVSPLSTLCDPYLNIFRGIIPPLGGTLDLSPILAFLVLNAFTSAAAALPAELPGSTSSQAIHLSGLGFTDLTTSQKKWMRRLCGNKSKSSTPSS